jgi:hypothetical protein
VIEVIVGERLAAPAADLANAPIVGEEHQEHGGVGDPRHVRNAVGNGFHLGAVGNVDHVGLLQVGFRRGRERAREEQPQQRRLDGAAVEAAMRTVLGHARKLVEAGQLGIDTGRGAEALGERGIDAFRGGQGWRHGGSLHRRQHVNPVRRDCPRRFYPYRKQIIELMVRGR